MALPDTKEFDGKEYELFNRFKDEEYAKRMARKTRQSPPENSTAPKIYSRFYDGGKEAEPRRYGIYRRKVADMRYTLNVREFLERVEELVGDKGGISPSPDKITIHAYGGENEELWRKIEDAAKDIFGIEGYKMSTTGRKANIQFDE